MTPDEQRMIQDLFQRLGAQGRVAKDMQADRVIQNGLGANPDAGYLLVQTALVYEHQMNEQEARIRELEDQIAQMQQAAAAPATGGGSFLGGRMGAGRGSVPPVAATAQASPWAAPQQTAGYQQPAAGRPPFASYPQAAPLAPQAPQGGGFFRSALQTAAGVAGGMMVANSLSGLFGGHEAHAAQAPLSTGDNAALADADVTQDALQDDVLEQDAQADATSDAGSWDDIET